MSAISTSATLLTQARLTHDAPLGTQRAEFVSQAAAATQSNGESSIDLMPPAYASFTPLSNPTAKHVLAQSASPFAPQTKLCPAVITQARQALLAPERPSFSDYRVQLGDFQLAAGKHLAQASLALRWYGRGVGPVFVVLGGISSHRVLCDDGQQKAWWDSFVGPRKALDTQTCQVLGVDFLGTGDSTRPRSLDEWAVSPADQARAIVQALDQLGLKQVAGVVGASYGGMVALHWAQRYPSSLQRALVLCAAHRSSVQTSAYRALQRQIVRFAAAQGATTEGLKLARSLAMLGFRSAQELDQRFPHPGELTAQQLVLPVEAYLQARGADYARKHSAASFLCLSQSCDLHQVNPVNIGTELWLAGAPNDQVVPYTDLLELAEKAPQVRFFQRLDSLYGHDCFLKENRTVGRLLQQFRQAQCADEGVNRANLAEHYA